MTCYSLKCSATRKGCTEMNFLFRKSFPKGKRRQSEAKIYVCPNCGDVRGEINTFPVRGRK